MCLIKLINNHYARHDSQPKIAYFPERGFEMGDILIKPRSKTGKLFFLTLITCHAVGFAVNDNRYSCHKTPQSLPTGAAWLHCGDKLTQHFQVSRFPTFGTC